MPVGLTVRNRMSAVLVGQWSRWPPADDEIVVAVGNRQLVPAKGIKPIGENGQSRRPAAPPIIGSFPPTCLVNALRPLLPFTSPSAIRIPLDVHPDCRLYVPTTVPVVMPHPHPPMQFSYPLPYGAILQDGGVRFVAYSQSATAMRVLLYRRPSDREPFEIIEFNPQNDRWGDIWSLFVPGLKPGSSTTSRRTGHSIRSRGTDSTAAPAHRSTRTPGPWPGSFSASDDGIIRPPKCVVVDDTFDWQGDRHLRRPLAESIIYEMHVRGFTKSDSSEGASTPAPTWA